MQSKVARPPKCDSPKCVFVISKDNLLLRLKCGHNLCIKSAKTFIKAIGNQDFLSYICLVCEEPTELIFNLLLENIEFVLE
jgi:hypothetical protein